MGNHIQAAGVAGITGVIVLEPSHDIQLIAIQVHLGNQRNRQTCVSAIGEHLITGEGGSIAVDGHIHSTGLLVFCAGQCENCRTGIVTGHADAAAGTVQRGGQAFTGIGQLCILGSNGRIVDDVTFVNDQFTATEYIDTAAVVCGIVLDLTHGRLAIDGGFRNGNGCPS